jgi:hypothetical protein
MPISRHPLNVVQISFFSDPEGKSPAELLQQWPTLSAVAEAASRAGMRESVIQAPVDARRSP